MPQIASLETYFFKIFRGACPRTPLEARALRTLGTHLPATLKFCLTTSKSVENTVRLVNSVLGQGKFFGKIHIMEEL